MRAPAPVRKKKKKKKKKHTNQKKNTNTQKTTTHLKNQRRKKKGEGEAWGIAKRLTGCEGCVGRLENWLSLVPEPTKGNGTWNGGGEKAR